VGAAARGVGLSENVCCDCQALDADVGRVMWLIEWTRIFGVTERVVHLARVGALVLLSRTRCRNALPIGGL